MADPEIGTLHTILSAFVDTNGDLNSAGGFAIGGLMNLVGIGLTVWFSYRGIRKTTKASHVQKVSEFRQQWIRDVRKVVAQFLNSCNSLHNDLLAPDSLHGEPKASDHIAAWKALTDARLLLNAHEVPHKELESSMQVVFEGVKKSATEYSELVLHVQNTANTVLKAEWKRVKDDLRMGKI